jgi:hypothetical protein
MVNYFVSNFFNLIYIEDAIFKYLKLSLVPCPLNQPVAGLKKADQKADDGNVIVKNGLSMQMIVH